MTDELKLKIVQACATYADDLNEVKEMVGLLTKQPMQKMAEKKNYSHDGVYVIFKDDTYRPWSDVKLELDKLDTHKVQSIGIVYHGYSFAVAMKTLKYGKSVQLTKRVSARSTCCFALLSALDDLDMERNTKTLRDAELGFELKDGEYIPTLGQLRIMFKLEYVVDIALAFLGGEPFTGHNYWSSTARSINENYTVNFSDGDVSWAERCLSYMVRPVMKFNPNFVD